MCYTDGYNEDRTADLKRVPLRIIDGGLSAAS
jgi:hypothetical protein